ncbi:MAG: hypothetical protein LUQ44_01320 [Methanothrix sp.]|nr:hypothetical protein [Methanothrix sp.]
MHRLFSPLRRYRAGFEDGSYHPGKEPLPQRAGAFSGSVHRADPAAGYPGSLVITVGHDLDRALILLRSWGQL